MRRCAEHRTQETFIELPRGLRGIYVLYQQKRRSGKTHFDVVYIGMAWSVRRGGIRGRLRKHKTRKGHLWTHFSIFEVWDNIRSDEIRELEGLFRHIYKRDARANSLNIVRGFKALKNVQNNRISSWRTG